MNRQTINIMLMAVFLFAIQVLIFNRLILKGMVSPFIYPMVILILPFSTPRWFELIFAFLFGLLLDIYSYTYGMHAAALVLLSWLRPWMKDMINPKGGYEDDDQPRLRQLGYIWFVTYCLVLLMIHHTAYFLLEAGNFRYFGFTLGKIALSAICSLVLIVIFEMIFSSKKARRV